MGLQKTRQLEYPHNLTIDEDILGTHTENVSTLATSGHFDFR
jgi:hypothetical protein